MCKIMMPKKYIPSEHNGLSWREIRFRATRHLEIASPIFFLYLWGSVLIMTQTVIDTPVKVWWGAYYALTIWGWMANIIFWVIIWEQEKAKKIYSEYIETA